MQAIDSAVLWPDGKVYFFRGNTYVSYDVALDRADPGPALRPADKWPGLEQLPPEAAVVWPNGKAYFFKGDHYTRFDLATNKVDAGSPFPTFPNWRGIEVGPNRSREVNAALVWTNGKAYFFQNDRYYRFDIKEDRVDVDYPKPISDGWPGLAQTERPFVGAFLWPKLIEGRQKAYFLQQSVYFRYDVVDDRVDPGYPRELAGNWPGL
jgi:Hemopexin